jgi:hypothetical protein
MLEYGLFTSVLGKEKVVLCRDQEATLPNDLDGLTYVMIGPPPSQPSDMKFFSQDSIDRLVKWAGSLHDVADKHPYARVVHSYSGRWQLHVQYKIWNRLVMGQADRSASNRSTLYLYIDREGKGRGMGTGRVSVRIGRYYAEFDSTDEFHDVHCLSDGSIRMKSKLVNRRLVTTDILPGLPDYYAEFEKETEAIIRGTVSGLVDTEWSFTPTAEGRFQGWHKIANDQDVLVESTIDMQRV